MSARHDPAAPALAHRFERDTLAAGLARHAPRGAVRVAEALAATAMNRRRRAQRLWGEILAEGPPRFDAVFTGLPEQPVSTRADAAWNAACRRIAARALSGAGADPTAGATAAAPLDLPAPAETPFLAARIGPYAFYRGDTG